ncbi:cytochrome c oxidase assembly protein COX14 homolog [Pygocentrus nattereri]|uniref:Cytochrome c oxidase assembly factor COX14 n=1 Tax=Pygocentrus nattereri TaxID=42514 RepID=A0A3B4D091_PYGNA|nr:cytochrome c oxidase assembly protein COX14 homolog [Pygocentrus nattereri]
MLRTKRMADMGYRLFSGSMMLLTVYGGYLCSMRFSRYMQRQKQLQLEAQDQTVDSEVVKD